MNDRNEKPEFARHLAAHRTQAAQQIAVALLTDEIDEPVTDLNLKRLDKLDDADIDFRVLGWFRRRCRLAFRFACLLASEPPAHRLPISAQTAETADAACPV